MKIMKKIIFNPATDKFENMEAEMVDVKTRKPNAVPPKTQTFKKPVAPMQDDFEIIYDAMDIFEKGTFNHNHKKKYGRTYAEERSRNKRFKKDN